jgi:uncharacterized membrane protein YfcA
MAAATGVAAGGVVAVTKAPEFFAVWGPTIIVGTIVTIFMIIAIYYTFFRKKGGGDEEEEPEDEE